MSNWKSLHDYRELPKCLRDGRGTAFNIVLGVFIPGMIGNIMNLKSVPAYPQQLINGVTVVVAARV